MIKLYTVIDNSRGRIKVFNFSEKNSAVDKRDEITKQYIGYTNGNYAVKQITSHRDDNSGVIIKNLNRNRDEEVGRVELFINYLDNEVVSTPIIKNQKKYRFDELDLPKTTISYLGKQGSGIGNFL